MPPTTVPVSETVYDVVVNGVKIADGVDEAEAHRLRTENPGAQLRTRVSTRSVKAAFVVWKDGQQVGDPYDEPGPAAKAARSVGGQIKMIPAT